MRVAGDYVDEIVSEAIAWRDRLHLICGVWPTDQ